MRFDEADIAQFIDRIRAGTEPIAPGEPSLVVDLADWLPLPRPQRRPRMRTAVGTTPPQLRAPEQSDGVPLEAMDDDADLSWLLRIDL